MDSCCKNENVTLALTSAVNVYVTGHVTVQTDETDTIDTIKTKALNQLSPNDLNFQIHIEKIKSGKD